MDVSDNAKRKPTRDFIQDVALVIGKVQQAFVTAVPHDWQRGLEITKDGLRSQILAPGKRLTLDIRSGQIIGDKLTLDFTNLSAQDSLRKLEQWVHKRNPSAEISQPVFSTGAPVFDRAQAVAIVDMLYEAQNCLMTLKQQLHAGITSPVLLYPHHFDVSFSWFPGSLTASSSKNDQQYTFGFSTGDETIPEPYFYTTAYPEPEFFTNIALPKPAYWQHTGFSGAILRRNDLINTQNANKLIYEYFHAVLGE